MLILVYCVDDIERIARLDNVDFIGEVESDSVHYFP